MKRIKLTILLTLAAMTAVPSYGQKLRYRDIIPDIRTMEGEELFNQVRGYLLEDSENPNLNLRMALIYEDNYTTQNILTHYEYCMGHAERARLTFFKAGLLISEQEISRNEEFYNDLFFNPDSSGTVTLELLINKIRKGQEDASNFQLVAPPIYQAFTKSVGFYDRVVREYSEINGRYANRDDLLMYFDEGHRNRLNRIKSDYDSAIYYFKEYQRLFKENPLKGTIQEFTIQPIKTYRLDGLMTRMNFLEKDLVFWDYKTWADDLLKETADVIVPLRKRLNDMTISLNKSLASSGNAPLLDFNAYRLSKSTLFQLKKYDHNSLLAALLEYREYRQNLENKLGNKGGYADSNESGRVYNFYSDVINSTILGDSLLTRVKRRLNEPNINKHPEYFNAHFNGAKGLTGYIDEEEKLISGTFSDFALLLRNTIIENHTILERPSGTVKHKNFILPLSADNYEGEPLDPGRAFTLVSKRNIDGRLYIGGIFKPGRNQEHYTAYLASLNEQNRLLWIKEYNVEIDSAGADANNYVTTLVLTQEGCAFTITAKHKEKGSILNTLFYLDEKGTEIFRRHIPETGIPRALVFRESNNSFVLGTMGDNLVQNPFQKGQLDIWGIHGFGDLLWNESLSFSGTLEGMINTQKGYLLAGNFSNLRTNDGKEHATNANMRQTNAFIADISDQGFFNLINPILTDKTYFIRDIVKVNDSNINLFGFDLNYQTNRYKPLDFDNNLIHIITNQDLDIITSNINP